MDKLMDDQSREALVNDLANGVQTALRSLATNAREVQQDEAIALADSVSSLVAEKILLTVLQIRQNGYAAGYSDGVKSRRVPHH